MCVHVCAHVCMCMYICLACLCACVCVCWGLLLWLCVCMSVSVCMSVCAHLSMSLMYAFVCVCRNLCACICVFVCAYLQVFMCACKCVPYRQQSSSSEGDQRPGWNSAAVPRRTCPVGTLLHTHYRPLCFFLNCLHRIMTFSGNRQMKSFVLSFIPQSGLAPLTVCGMQKTDLCASKDLEARAGCRAVLKQWVWWWWGSLVRAMKQKGPNTMAEEYWEPDSQLRTLVILPLIVYHPAKRAGHCRFA